MENQQASQSTATSMLDQYPYCAALALGSNQGDRAAYLLRAIGALIAAGLPIVACSSIYQTAPMDYLTQPDFLNMVVLTAGQQLPAPLALLANCLEIEQQLGRVRTVARGPRTIDIDLLCYRAGLQQISCQEVGPPNLILPHPRMQQRRFVMLPLVEVWPTGQHPQLHQSFPEILAKLTQQVVENYRN